MSNFKLPAINCDCNLSKFWNLAFSQWLQDRIQFTNFDCQFNSNFNQWLLTKTFWALCFNMILGESNRLTWLLSSTGYVLRMEPLCTYASSWTEGRLKSRWVEVGLNLTEFWDSLKQNRPGLYWLCRMPSEWRKWVAPAKNLWLKRYLKNTVKLFDNKVKNEYTEIFCWIIPSLP